MSEDQDKSTLSEHYKALSYSNTEFDKQVLFIASGALGISMSVIDKIVTLDHATNKCLLMASWFIFGLTIFISLLNHFISQKAIRWSIKNANMDAAAYDPIEKVWNTVISIFNISMMILLLLGISLLICFIDINI